jgi:hypothetical protein
VKRFVAEVTLTVDAEGGTQTFLFTEGSTGFRTRPTDTPANTWVEPRIKSLGRLERSLFSGARVTGAIKPAGATLYLENADGGLDGWLDYGVSGSRVTYRWGDETAAYPGGYEAVQIMYIQSFKLDFESVQFGLRDRSYLLDKPVVTRTFAGTGGLEGTGVASKKMPFLSSDPAFYPPILIDVVKQIYCISESGPSTLSSFYQMFEGGVEIERGADYGSETEILTTQPLPGTCRYWFGPLSGAYRTGPVYVRLGTPPALELRTYALGYQSTGAAWSFSAMCRRAGLDDVSGDVGSIGARLVDDDSTYLSVMEAACVQYQQFFGFDRLDTFRAGLLVEPDDDASVFTFTVDNARDFKRNPPAGMESPVHQVTLNAGKTYPCPYADSASDTMKDYLSRDPWWTSFTGSSAATLLANPGAISVELSTPNRDIQNTFSQSNFIARYLGLFGGRRDFITLTAQAFSQELLEIELHDTVEVRIPRMQCENGRFFRVININIDWTRREITFGLWGGTPGDGGSIDTGGGSSTLDLTLKTEDGDVLLTEDNTALLMESPPPTLTSTGLFIQCENDDYLLTEDGAQIEMEGGGFTFAQQAVIPYSDLTPSALRFFTETFAADTGQFTRFTESTQGTFTVSGGQATLSNSSGAARNDIIVEGSELTMPQAGVQIDVVSRSGTLSGYSNIGVGICKDANNFVWAGYDAVLGDVRVQLKISGANTFNGGVTRTLTPPYKLGFSLIGNSACVYVDEGSGWEYVTGYAIPTGTINFKTASLTGWKAGWTVAVPNNHTWVFDNFIAGRFGGVASRDYSLVTEENCSPYVVDVGGNDNVYLCATAVDGLGTGYQAVLRLDLATFAITQTSAIMISRSGAKQNDTAGHVVRYSDTSQILTITTWGNGFSAAIDLHYASYTGDLLSGSHLVSGTVKLTLPSQASGYAAYDGMLMKEQGVWKLTHTVCENLTFSGSPFYPVVSVSTDLSTWTTSGSQPTHKPYEGTKWCLVGGENYVTASSTTQSRLYSDTLYYYGEIDATFDGGSVTQPHSMIFEVNGTTYLVTFDDEKATGATASFTWGRMVVHTRVL